MISCHYFIWKSRQHHSFFESLPIFLRKKFEPSNFPPPQDDVTFGVRVAFPVGWRVVVAGFRWWVPWVQESYNTPQEHTPGNPPTQLWKISLYSLLEKVKGCGPKVCWNNLRLRFGWELFEHHGHRPKRWSHHDPGSSEAIPVGSWRVVPKKKKGTFKRSGSWVAGRCDEDTTRQVPVGGVAMMGDFYVGIYPWSHNPPFFFFLRFQVC